MLQKYREYFNIDPDFFAQVNEAVIETQPNIWQKYYPHATFVKLIKDTVSVLSRQQKLSIWVEGAYGTGKSYAVLTLKKLLDANEKDTKAYFEKYNLDNDLLNKFQGEKNSGKILTVHRYGSASIRGDNDLVLAIQESIEKALNSEGIENQGPNTLKNAIIKWLSDTDNKHFFNALITGSYSKLFGGDTVDIIINKLQTYTDDALQTLMDQIFKVAKERQINAFTLTTTDLCNWIKEIIKANGLKAIVFIWDEFTEYFNNNLRGLTGFQEIAEISATDPFYLMIVTHKSAALFSDADKDKRKILDRFISPTCMIQLPENIAFQLMGAAMEKNQDPSVLADWNATVTDLYDRTRDSRKIIKDIVKISDDELMKILPIHPYTALLLKHISSGFDSNQRSMFDFIKNDRGEEIKGFQWFIDNYGPLDANPLLTVDMLWDFFYEKGRASLSTDIRTILDCYARAETKQLSSDEKRVLKAVLLLQAISQKVGGSVEFFVPNDKNINNAFEGTDIEREAARIAAKLERDKIIYKKSLGGGEFQYSALTGGVDTGKIEEIKEQLKDRPTATLIQEGSLSSTLNLPKSLALRYSISYASISDFDTVIKRLRAEEDKYLNKLCAVVTLAKDDNEAATLNKKIKDAVSDGSYKMIFIDATTTPMGRDAIEQYCENKANAQYQNGKDNNQARTYDTYALQVLTSWRDRIAKGEFLVFSQDLPDGKRFASADGLYSYLQDVNLHKFPYCLEQYTVTDSMYQLSSLKMGAECGAKQDTMGIFKSANPTTKLEEALKGAWKVNDYWKTAPNLMPISKIKIAVEEKIVHSFKEDGRVSVTDIYSMLKQEPYGFLPCNLTAFVLGFVLKEYVDGSYTWSDGLTNDAFNIAKLKEVIDEVIKLDVTPNNRFKDKYIVTMTAEEKAFNEATASAFSIPASFCTSIEQTRERIRGKMKELSFPVWVLQYILDNEPLTTDKQVISTLIENYSYIANNNNAHVNKTDSDIALEIGKLCIKNPKAVNDLQSLFTKEKCTSGMIAYLDQFKDGELPRLANEIKDNHFYVNALRNKFDADAANWVWNKETANQKIDEMIVEYKIIAESNKIMSSQNTNFAKALADWSEKCNYIRISYPMCKEKIGDATELFDILYELRRNGGHLAEAQKSKFLTALSKYGTEFRTFFENQSSYFKDVCAFYIDGFADDEINAIFAQLPLGSFSKEKSEYTSIVAKVAEDYKNSLGYSKLKKLWKDKTKTTSPAEWSEKYKMPIFALIDDDDMQRAHQAFDVLNKPHPDNESVKKAMEFLENGNFYDRLNDEDKRDTAFKNTIINEYSVILQDVDAVKNYLYEKVGTEPYLWLGIPEVKKKIQQLAEAQYNKNGYEKALAKIDKMDTEDVKSYIKKLIKDDMILGIQIIKNSH